MRVNPLLLMVAMSVVACTGESSVTPPASPSPSTTAPEATVVLTEGDACGDAFFWAASGEGDIAVTVAVEAWDRSRRATTTIDFTLPDPSVEVEILRGGRLQRNFCTDLPDPASDPRSRQPATAGDGTITLDPKIQTCGVTGTLELDGLIGQDGTIFAPINVRSGSIGCYAG